MTGVSDAASRHGYTQKMGILKYPVSGGGGVRKFGSSPRPDPRAPHAQIIFAGLKSKSNAILIKGAEMARGGARPGAGRPPKAGRAPTVKNEAAAHRPRKSLGGMTPLEYMLSVMTDDDADPIRRDRMAMAAAPYVHPRAADAQPGKKEQRQTDAEEVASGGKFAPRAAPRLAVSNA